MKLNTLPDKAKTQESLRLYKEALHCFQKSLEIDSEQPEVLERIEETNGNIRFCEYIIDKHEILSLYEKFCKLDKKDIINNKDVSELEEKLRKIISNFPNDIEAIVMLQKVFISSNRLDEVSKIKIPKYD